MKDVRLSLTSVPLNDHDVELRRLSGTEALSTPFLLQLELELKADAPWTHAEIAELQSQVTYLICSDGSTAWTGFLRSVDYVAAGIPDRFHYRAELVPTTWALSLFRRSRVFQDLTVPGILKSVLAKQGLEVLRDATTSTLPVREYTVQYEESDLDLVSRLLEHEGIFYFLRKYGQELVIGDDNAAFDRLEGHEFLRWVRRLDGGKGLTDLSFEHRIVPEHAAVRDYDWRAPSTLVQGDSAANEHGMGLQVFFGEHVRSADAKRLATVRAQELALPHARLRATTNVLGLSPGHRFTLEAPADVGPELDGLDVVVQSVRHHLVQAVGPGDKPEPYRNEVVLFPYGTAFRPERRTPRPRIDGVVYAVVDGAGGSTAAPVDDQGRYRVYFPFDTNAKAGGGASRWVRMAQPYAGAGYGMHLPLHVGTQVLVAHVNGDPDRPVIVGAIPNAATTSPVAQANATQSAIRSHNGILFEMEDDA